jgi:hypothetical protein
MSAFCVTRAAQGNDETRPKPILTLTHWRARAGAPALEQEPKLHRVAVRFVEF